MKLLYNLPLSDHTKSQFCFFANAPVCKQKLPPLNFLSWFLSSPQFAHCRPRSCGRQRAKAPHKTKTHAKKFSLPTPSWLVLWFTTVLFSIASFAQIQTPQFGQFQPMVGGQSYSPNQSSNQYNNNNYNSGRDQQIINEVHFKNTQTQSQYYNPSAENNFNQNSPQVRAQADMYQTLQEVSYANHVIGENGYYSSSTYLNDLPNYTKAKENIKKMLSGEKPLSIKDAYYNSESAFGNLHLSYEEYNKTIQENVKFIKQWLMENGYNLKDPEALHLGIQKFLSDTLYVGAKSLDQMPVSKKSHTPYYYDYIDYTSAEDRRNYFVTKTFATGTGQCHTLPVTYLILAEALGVETFLSYNPTHSFIRYKNNKGTMLNYETTVDRFLPDAFYLETLPAMAKAKKNNIYMNNLNKKQIVATVMIDLAVNFVQEHWLSDRKFIKECMSTAAPYFQNADYVNTANDYLNKRLYADTFNKKVKEKGIKNLSEIKKYPDVMEAYKNLQGYMEKVSSLGIQDFPESEYIRMMEYYDEKGKLQTAKKIDAKSKKNLFTTY